MSAFRFVHLRHLRHLPFGWWSCTIILAATAAFLVSHTIERADAAAERLGELTTISVATRDLAIGSLLETSDLRTVDWPRALLPSSPLAPMPVGSRLTAPLFEGEPIVAGKLAPAGRSAVAALLDADDRAVDIPAKDVTPNVEIGDNVELITPKRSIAGRVVAKGEHSTTVAVDREDVGVIAETIKSHDVTIAVAP